MPAQSLPELVEWLKANPAQRSYATPGAGTLPHFFGVLFARAAGLDLQHINYRGSAAALTDLIGGQVPVLVTTTTDLLEMHKAGRIRVLATSEKARSPFLPELPTFREAGYDIEGTGWYGVFAPARTPGEISSATARCSSPRSVRRRSRIAWSASGSLRPGPRSPTSPPSSGPTGALGAGREGVRIYAAAVSCEPLDELKPQRNPS